MKLRTHFVLAALTCAALSISVAASPQAPRPLRLRKPLPAGWTMATIEKRLSVGVPGPVKSSGADIWTAAAGTSSVTVGRQRDRRGLSSTTVLQAMRARCLKGDRCTFVRDATVPGAALAFVMRSPEFENDAMLAVADGDVSWTVMADAKIADAVFDSVRLVGGARK